MRPTPNPANFDDDARSDLSRAEGERIHVSNDRRRYVRGDHPSRAFIGAFFAAACPASHQALYIRPSYDSCVLRLSASSPPQVKKMISGAGDRTTFFAISASKPGEIAKIACAPALTA